VSDLWQTHLFWLFEGRRYFHLHARQCGISRAIPERWKYPRPYRNSLHSNSTKNKRPISQSIPLAPAEIRDAVFRELIKISPASNYREELVTGPGGLLSLIQRYSRFMKSPHPVEQEKAEVELNQLMDRIRVITEATLLTTGFHTHKRQWRKMRNG
jgi:hypothetical protein